MGNQMINARPEMLAVKPSLDRSLDVIETYPIRMRWTKMLQNGSSLYFKVFFGI